MNSQWQRRRQPDDVPTPVAVAVSDFCRRAKAAASPSEVREALALLTEEEDFRVRTLTDTEPEASPLGPFAVIDILRGTAASLASQRQACGYYEVVQELARVHEEKKPDPLPAQPAVPTFAAPPPRPAPAGEASAEGSQGKDGKASRSGAPTVQERIAPRKRATEAEAPEPFESEDDAPRFLKRDLPKPRGRFTQVAAPKGSYQTLVRAEGKDVLEPAIEQNEHRFALLKSLAEQYNGSKGELKMPDVESVLRLHDLLDPLADRERQAILAAYTEHRGAAGRVAWALGLSPSELQRLISTLQLQQEVEDVRERFRREALGSRQLTQRLDMLGRDKYLVDLGIKKRFSEMLRKDLEALVDDELPDAQSLSGLAEAVSRKHGAPQELVLRAIERLGLADSLREQLGADSDHSLP
ncbi:hypothetical protein [Hyalangium rubrum]|uniref:Uncharacterized protein n=1 Tax=Hyalangium rubrum TaxID=3103134 RepID=A0ABU5HDF0_9BACT|nr:hypothetical protein [Hyalangium sp. s54d21]MDY7231483.1 hypothetical protein [Hyalangium sp. s54d21]